VIYFYNQSTGQFYDEFGKLLVIGYSGYPPHKNDASAQRIHDQGPIPRGFWKCSALFPTHNKLGPVVIELTPSSFTDTFGRSGFFIHGESIAHPGFASHGCLILPRPVREQIMIHDNVSIF
jgi:hypothetical protein